MKKFLLISVFILGSLAVTAWAMLPPSVHEWTITDPSTAQSHTFSDWFHSWLNGSMSIRVSGRLDQAASIQTPLGRMGLPAGEFDLVSRADEIWQNQAEVAFTPGRTGTGTVKVQVCLGTFPDWARGVNGNCAHCVQ